MLRRRLTPEIIAVAVEGYESQKAGIDQKIAALRAMLDGGPAGPTATPEPTTRKRRRKMSAAARRRIAEAQRERWAAYKKSAERSAPQETPKPKRKLSRAGRAAIIAATKKRWALKRAEAATAQRAAKKAASARKKAAA